MHWFNEEGMLMMSCSPDNKKNASEWISVEDELPEKPRNYLVYVPPFYINVVFYNGYEWVVDEDEYCFHGSEITHWMFLPEPPKEG